MYRTTVKYFLFLLTGRAWKRIREEKAARTTPMSMKGKSGLVKQFDRNKFAKLALVK